MVSKYNDTAASMQVVGCILRKPDLIDDERYFFTENDFTSELHKVIFGTVFNLYQMGATNFSINAIEDYLSSRPTSFGIYKSAKGNQWIAEVKDAADLDNFDYYYSRVKKMTLLRGYEKAGMNLEWLYDPDNIQDMEKKRKQEDELDNASLQEIADMIDERIISVRSSCVDNASDEAMMIGDGIFELLERLETVPEIGLPLYGMLINGVTRGARKKKLYIRSGSTGVGKSRTMIADACYLSCGQMYINGEWKYIGSTEPVLVITTELEKDEVQTMALAFLSGVNEEKIISNTCDAIERFQVQRAASILSEAPFYIEVIPDFSVEDIENCIKRNIRLNHTSFVFFDYIMTSMKILEEITRKSGGVKIREDNVLILLATKLKEIANKYDVFILTSTQLSGDFRNEPMPDQTMLRGAKGIADCCDIGMILLDTTKRDRDALEQFCSDNGIQMPNVKLSIYKNRRGSFTRGYLWMQADKGTCRYNPIFATNWNYEIVDIYDFEISEYVSPDNLLDEQDWIAEGDPVTDQIMTDEDMGIYF